MDAAGPLTVKLFGKLQTLYAGRGLPPAVELTVPASGVRASDLALQMDLPIEDVEGVFCNHKVYGLDHVLHPGDSVAFVPRGTPGPHRFTLGLYAAGRGSEKS